MNSIKPTYLLLVALAGLLTIGCSGEKKAAAQKVEPAKEQVHVLELQEQIIGRTIEYPTALKAFEENYLSSAQPGRIEKIYVEVATKVTKGQLLVQMDRTQLHTAQIQLKNLTTDYNRMDTLVKAGSISKQIYDQAKSQYEIAKANVDFLTENTKLVAPFSGIVSGKFYENNEMYSGAPNTAAGKAAIVSLVQIDKLKAFISVPEKFFPQIKMGMPVKILCDIYPDQKFDAQVFRIHPTIDADAHTFEVEVKVPNGKELLRPGMFSRATFELDEVKALLVPANSVLKLQGSNDRYVFVYDNGKAKRVNVTLGSRYNDQIELISDQVKAGDKLIVSGQSRLLDQVEVEIAK